MYINSNINVNNNMWGSNLADRWTKQILQFLVSNSSTKFCTSSYLCFILPHHTNIVSIKNNINILYIFSFKNSKRKEREKDSEKNDEFIINELVLRKVVI